MSKDERGDRLHADLEGIRVEVEKINSAALQAFHSITSVKTADSVTYEYASTIRRELENIMICLSGTKTHLANISWELRTNPQPVT